MYCFDNKLVDISFDIINLIRKNNGNILFFQNPLDGKIIEKLRKNQFNTETSTISNKSPTQNQNYPNHNIIGNQPFEKLVDQSCSLIIRSFLEALNQDSPITKFDKLLRSAEKSLTLYTHILISIYVNKFNNKLIGDHIQPLELDKFFQKGISFGGCHKIIQEIQKLFIQTFNFYEHDDFVNPNLKSTKLSKYFLRLIEIRNSHSHNRIDDYQSNLNIIESVYKYIIENYSKLQDPYWVGEVKSHKFHKNGNSEFEVTLLLGDRTPNMNITINTNQTFNVGEIIYNSNNKFYTLSPLIISEICIKCNTKEWFYLEKIKIKNNHISFFQFISFNPSNHKINSASQLKNIGSLKNSILQMFS